MDNDATIPSQLGPMTTIPSILGARDASHRRSGRSTFYPALKWALLTALAAIILYVAK